MTFAQRVKQDVIDLIPNSYQFDQSQLEEMLGDDLAGRSMTPASSSLTTMAR